MRKLLLSLSLGFVVLSSASQVVCMQKVDSQLQDCQLGRLQWVCSKETTEVIENEFNTADRVYLKKLSDKDKQELIEMLRNRLLFDDAFLNKISEKMGLQICNELSDTEIERMTGRIDGDGDEVDN